ncbi:hypothetical protein [Nonomuraea sp. NPDC001699]
MPATTYPLLARSSARPVSELRGQVKPGDSTTSGRLRRRPEGSASVKAFVRVQLSPSGGMVSSSLIPEPFRSSSDSLGVT